MNNEIVDKICDETIKYARQSGNMIYKVRPLVDHLNKKFSELREPFGKEFSIDEAMEPYNGRHSMKQFIMGIPIRYGFKFWCLTTSDGYLLRFDPYQGKAQRPKGVSLGTMVTI
uniref:PiggyBac transposable element-derived protein domain-containing protein n=1 Tax=Phlebotomus papatasi TaxID=29031 RepID=A0A1B0DPW9_PHLPP